MTTKKEKIQKLLRVANGHANVHEAILAGRLATNLARSIGHGQLVARCRVATFKAERRLARQDNN